jgi:LysM repeat protein
MATPRSQPKPRVSIVARVLAPLALVAVVIGLIVVISGSMSDSDGGGHHARHAGGGHHQQHQTTTTPDTYVVQQNDTLDGIAAKTGVSVDQLQKLNPDVDTQALAPGSTLKLR